MEPTVWRHSNPKAIGDIETILLHLEFSDYLFAYKSKHSQAIHLTSIKTKGEKMKVWL